MAAWYHPSGDGGTSGGGPIVVPDTHAHLDAEVFRGHEDEIVERALAAGVDRILAVGSDLASSETAVALAQRFESVYAAVGIHPHEVEKFPMEATAVRALLAEKKVVAVGEIGLDFARGTDARPAQLEAFREELGWARQLSRPVSVHNRAADHDILAELDDAGVSAVLHCFSGGSELAKRALAAGHFLSFAGNVTFPKAQELRAVAAGVPAGRLFVETDSPVLAPAPWRGKTNEPEHVTETARVVARARGAPLAELCAAVTRNADAVFGWRNA
jgi:TatD DNase family protein